MAELFWRADMKTDSDQDRSKTEEKDRFVSAVERDELILAMAVKIEDLESRIEQVEGMRMGSSATTATPVRPTSTSVCPPVSTSSRRSSSSRTRLSSYERNSPPLGGDLSC